MLIEHKIDVDEAIDKVKEAFPIMKVLSATKQPEPVPEKDNINYKEFRFRIKTREGTDINIPSSFIGLIIGVVATKIVFTMIGKAIDGHRNKNETVECETE